MAVSKVWAAETGCTRSGLHTKTNAPTAVESYCERKTARCKRGSRKFRSLQLRFMSSFGSNIFYFWYIFCSNANNASLLWVMLNIFHVLGVLFLGFARYFESGASLPTYWHLSLTKSGISTGISGRHAAKTTSVSSPFTSEALISSDILFAAQCIRHL